MVQVQKEEELKKRQQPLLLRRKRGPFVVFLSCYKYNDTSVNEYDDEASLREAAIEAITHGDRDIWCDREEEFDEM